jgi:hypothetical protein
MALRVDHAHLARMRDQLLFDGAGAARKLRSAPPAAAIRACPDCHVGWHRRSHATEPNTAVK